jgi:hypothetical protein
MASAQTKQTPLEMLVIFQLAAIRRSEAVLQQELISNPSLEASHFAADLWKLRASTDRLGRMIDAMNLNGNSFATLAGRQTAA